ncbi:antitoxin VbhA family protein [Streptomyces scabiei]|uniref:antitoxin VbhA family protein n=1 Tax=Streptomyces scabiei TaxID=1930 RepID=UPI002990328F|nr:antitoxin VbhA family protein [Streptomyces scabiei]MDW8807641.1 antitoxin VbhA family protein [Streptomyces scabiei]
MRVPEIVTVSDARSGLSRILAELAEVGPEAVESATGSLAAEGLRPTAASDQDAEAHVRGTLSAEEMTDHTLARHTPGGHQESG